jgi:hypothetical protein
LNGCLVRESEDDEWWGPRTQWPIPEAAPTRPQGGQLSHPKAVKWRRLRRKEEETGDQEWERARQEAWLREMLSDTSSSESEEGSERFAESRRWMSELFEIS